LFLFVFDFLLHFDVFQYQQLFVIFLNLELYLDFLMHSNIEFEHYIDDLDKYEKGNLLKIKECNLKIFSFFFLPRNFFGGLCKSPESGWTTQRSSTSPSVLINPQTVPSAYKAIVSPILRKLDVRLDSIILDWRLLVYL